MYTLRIDNPPQNFVLLVQAFIQENKLWTYEVEAHTMKLSTKSVRDLKRLVDILESVEQEDLKEYLERKYS